MGVVAGDRDRGEEINGGGGGGGILWRDGGSLAGAEKVWGGGGD